MPATAEKCANCGAPLLTQYCALCGERRLERDHLQLSRFLAAAIEEVTDLEHSKLLRTTRALFLQPGLLTNEYLRGRRQSFIGPVKIFLTLFALSFILYSICRPTAVYDLQTFISQDRSGNWQAILIAAAQKANISQSSMIAEVNARWRSYISLTQAVYPVGLALLLQVLYVRSGRYFAEHLIFALHFSSFAFGLLCLFWPVYALVGVGLSRPYLIATVVAVLVLFLWLFLATRRVYGQKWVKTLLKSITLQVGYLVMGECLAVATLGLAFAMVIRAH